MVTGSRYLFSRKTVSLDWPIDCSYRQSCRITKVNLGLPHRVLHTGRVAAKIQ